MRRLSSLVLTALVCSPLYADDTLGSGAVPPPPKLDHAWCSTSAGNNARLDALHEWARTQQSIRPRSSNEERSMEIRIEDDLILLEADSWLIPFDHPFDLAGRSLVYEPDGENGFTVTAEPLQWDVDVGGLFHAFAEDADDVSWYYRQASLTELEFPFAGVDRTTFYVSAFHGITFSRPDIRRAYQYDALEAAAIDEPIIAPLLFSRHPKRQFMDPRVYVKETTEAVTITWRIEPTEFFEYEIQARLESSGRIVLSYGAMRNIGWGSVIVSTGREPWRSRVRSFEFGTPDHDPIVLTPRQMLTIEGVTLDRLGGTPILELSLDLGSPVARRSLGDATLYYEVSLGPGDVPVAVWVTRDETWYYRPEWGWALESPAVRFEGDQLHILVDERPLGAFQLGHGVIDIFTFLSEEGIIDQISEQADFGKASIEEIGVDLDKTIGKSTLSAPALEAFTLPALDPESVWLMVRDVYGFGNDDIDGVAIYQDFLTDLALYASAYSTVGNAGVDGISLSSEVGSKIGRRPALLHMNRADFGLNVELDVAMHVLSHELGHRWLYFINIDTGSGATNVLRPGGGHPAQYVHMPVAFNVYSNRDSSTMGGAWFTDNQNGTFTAPDPVEYYGYTWHELYLMGLASPDEVEDWYYIEDSDPALGPAYYPPAGITVRGTRRNVAIEDLIRAMGPRFPVYPRTQNRFRMLYVLLHHPGDEPDPEMIERVVTMKVEFDRVFPLITGGRGSIESRIVPPPRRRGVRK